MILQNFEDKVFSLMMNKVDKVPEDSLQPSSGYLVCLQYLISGSGSHQKKYSKCQVECSEAFPHTQLCEFQNLSRQGS